jgi:DNA repair protein SbcD/Mre11
MVAAMKFVHCADVHLDSPLRGLNAYEGAPTQALRGATRKGFENIIDLCLDEEADFLVIAGDLYDGEWPDFNTGLYFAKQMARLEKRGVEAFVVRGNHDAESKITQRLSPPGNVHVFGFKKPETRTVERHKVALHGQSFAKRDTFDNLAARYPNPVPGYFNVGVLHTAVAGNAAHSAYAPCALDELRARGYDYWALGHVHAREVLSESPWVVFPGNVQGRSVRETGPKGCTVVTAESGRVTTEHRSVDVLRWAHLTIDATGAGSVDEVLGRIQTAIRQARSEADGRFLAARIRVEGRSAAHDAIARSLDLFREQVRAAGIEAGREDVWIEKVEARTAPLRDLDELRRRDDAIGELLRSVREVTADETFLGVLAGEVSALLQKLPNEVREAVALPDLTDADKARAVLADAEQLLLARVEAWGAAR